MNEITYMISKFFAGYALLVFVKEKIIALEIAQSRKTLEHILKKNTIIYTSFLETKKITKLSSNSAVFSNAKDILLCLEKHDPVPREKIHLNGTVFQKQVWEQIRRIPTGETRTYRDIATAAGNPKGARAAAGACAANKIALIIPCHRVICADGTIGNYRWGGKIKQFLLAREGTLF